MHLHYIYTYIYIICKHILITFFNETELIFATHLNGFKYFYLQPNICQHTTKSLSIAI